MKSRIKRSISIKKKRKKKLKKQLKKSKSVSNYNYKYFDICKNNQVIQNCRFGNKMCITDFKSLMNYKKEFQESNEADEDIPINLRMVESSSSIQVSNRMENNYHLSNKQSLF